jgi:hypothetical protein
VNVNKEIESYLNSGLLLKIHFLTFDSEAKSLHIIKSNVLKSLFSEIDVPSEECIISIEENKIIDLESITIQIVEFFSVPASLTLDDFINPSEEIKKLGKLFLLDSEEYKDELRKTILEITGFLK